METNYKTISVIQAREDNGLDWNSSYIADEKWSGFILKIEKKELCTATVAWAQTPGDTPLIEMENTVVKAGLEKGRWQQLSLGHVKHEMP